MSSSGRLPRFEIRASSIQGLGAFATRRIRKGTRLIEYRGERISPAEADLRYDDDPGPSPQVLFFQVDTDTLIDAGVDGNDAKFINHSCEPNCEAVTEAGRVYIDAVRTIQPGEELTYDYRLERPGCVGREWEERHACRCGARTCRGTLLGTLPTSRKKLQSRRRPANRETG